MTHLIRGSSRAMLAGFVLLAACGDSGTTGPDTPVVASIVVTPDAAQLDALGMTADFVAQARDGAGSPIPGVSFTWTSSSPAVATVNDNGRVTSVGDGTSTITAAAAGRSGTAALTVAQAVSLTASSFSVAPGAVRADGSTPIQVSITLVDGNGQPVAGRQATIDVSGEGNSVTQPPQTDESGQATGSFTSTAEGERTVRVWVGTPDGGDALAQTEQVEFIPLDACDDEDGDGVCDAVSCDAGLPLDPADPAAAAAAMGICATVAEDGYGLVDASYTRANGAVIAVNTHIGVLDAFGPNVEPQEGSAFLVLSSGRARTPGQDGSCGTHSCAGVGAGVAPVGFPQASQGCPVSTSIYDDVALTVTLKAPANAKGLAFRFNYYTFDYPTWVCGQFNDQFVVLMDPAPTGAVGGNVALDPQGNPISVNASFLEVCDGCPRGSDELVGTGFDTWAGAPAGATGWLRTTIPVEGRQELTLRFIIWDTGDSSFDSTVLLDGFEWLLDSVETATAR